MNAFDHYCLGAAYAREQLTAGDLSVSSNLGVSSPSLEPERLPTSLLSRSEANWLAFEARELGDTESEEFWSGYAAVMELANVRAATSEVAA